MSTALKRILKEGMLAGMMAYLAVVLALGLMNALQGESVFRTAAAMGSLLFYGAEASSRVSVEAGPVLAYNGVHLLGSIAVGLLGAVQLVETEAHRSFWYISLIVLIAVVIYSITVFGVFGVEVGGVLDWSTVLLGTGVWILSMTGYFWWAHRGLVGRIREDMSRAV